jgi:hypothetical protein
LRHAHTPPFLDRALRRLSVRCAYSRAVGRLEYVGLEALGRWFAAYQAYWGSEKTRKMVRCLPGVLGQREDHLMHGQRDDQHGGQDRDQPGSRIDNQPDLPIVFRILRASNLLFGHGKALSYQDFSLRSVLEKRLLRTRASTAISCDVTPRIRRPRARDGVRPAGIKQRERSCRRWQL